MSPTRMPAAARRAVPASCPSPGRDGAAANEIVAATADGGRVLFTRSPTNMVMDVDSDPASDALVIGTLAGGDDVSLDPALDGLILVTVL